MTRRNHRALRTRTLFTYGVLRERDTISSVIGYPYTGRIVPAILPGHIAIRDAGPAYAVPQEHEVIEGFLLEGLSEYDFIQLDRLEGTERHHYNRMSCTVVTNDGEIATEYYRAGPGAQARIAYRATKANDFASVPLHEDVIDVDEESNEAEEWYREFQRQNREDLESGMITAEEAAHLADILNEEEAAERFYAPSLALLDKAAALDTKPTPAVAPYRPVYAGTSNHLPDRRGIPLDESLRTNSSPDDATNSLFVFDGLRSLDRLEMVINREWFGRRTAAHAFDMKIKGQFPAFAVIAEGEQIDGHLLDGLTLADLAAVDKYMNVSSGFHVRTPITFGKRDAFMYCIGPKGESIMAKAQQRQKLTRKARRSAEAARKRQAIKVKADPRTAWEEFNGPYDLDGSASTTTYFSGPNRSLIPVTRTADPIPFRGTKAMVSWQPSR